MEIIEQGSLDTMRYECPDCHSILRLGVDDFYMYINDGFLKVEEYQHEFVYVCPVCNSINWARKEYMPEVLLTQLEGKFKPQIDEFYKAKFKIKEEERYLSTHFMSDHKNGEERVRKAKENFNNLINYYNKQQFTNNTVKGR